MSDTATIEDTSTSTQKLPPYNIVVYNDDFHTFEFVTIVLSEVFKHTIERAYQLANEIHDDGRAIVWSGGKELGELKLEQLLTFHEGKHGPLSASLELG